MPTERCQWVTSWRSHPQRTQPVHVRLLFVLQGLFFLSLFFITVIGIVLLGGPDSMDSITNYNSPERMEARKKITKQMAEFLSKNPEVLARGFDHPNTPPSPTPRTPDYPTKIGHSTPVPPNAPPQPMDLFIQGETIHFETMNDLNQWVYAKTKTAPLELIEHLEKGMDPDIKFELLKRIPEIDPSPEVKERVLESVIREGSIHLRSPDERSQQLAQKYFSYFLENEDNSEKGKKRIDQILNSHQ
jgi:hypothetical protein